MTAYDLEIRHPHHHSDDEAEFFEEMSAQEIMEKFNAMNWKQLQILMLQMRGGKAEFTVTDNMQNLAVQISLIEMPETEALTFNFESDIEVSVEQSNLFGFLKYSKAVDVAFQGLNLAAARHLLDAFTHQELDVIRKLYLQPDKTSAAE
ncbi:hypothetical protein F941_00657 [Acinetobacter bouvetii DSM 14964 = CIP 107468]|uniref:Uncharacterized protein n=1 Tax=Acinetobacter bouvetii DSM 14964 = CIP 107468 TaxID=1120925 RepID=N9DT28_9GAMM|nr:hypothetical protein [Acinetobacter bouvetii]ENV83825.1 hypothetical protein F941_00657 [Acinetobacter bouvetii DSM 14964 = CIP 107468]BCU65695.1 hypothetical protein ACBO_24860 [Acinetobacter bouvetii]